jgi:hypothetical protein
VAQADETFEAPVPAARKLQSGVEAALTISATPLRPKVDRAWCSFGGSVASLPWSFSAMVNVSLLNIDIYGT